MRQIILNHRVIFINALLCAVIAFPFGVVSDHILEWVLAGLTFGIVMGALADGIFLGLVKQKKLTQRRLLILVLIEALLAVYVLAPGYGAYNVVHPIRHPVSVTPADLGIEYEEVELTTSDGIKLAGWYVPSQNHAAVIAVHALQGNRTNTIYHLQALAQHGYGVLAFDLRAHGESGGNKFGGGWDSDKDVLAAVAFLEQGANIDPERIGALGLSVGASVIIHAAADDDAIQALWADGTGVGRLEDLQDPLPPEFRPLWFMSPVYWMYDRMIEIMSGVVARPPIKEEVKNIPPRAILFVSTGQGWEQFQSRKYHANAGETALLWELPEDTHIGGLFAHPEEYGQKMISFFDEYLLSK